MHVVYRFSVGGLENGVVNLINHMPESRFRHCVVALTECDPDFTHRVHVPSVEFISLNKPPGHGIKLYPRLFRLFRQYRPAIVHTRNLAALEAAVPAWAAGVRTRVHGEHGWDVSDPGGMLRKNQRIRRAYSPFVKRYVALSGHIERYLVERVGVAAERIERICNGVDTARFHPAPGGARIPLADSPFGSRDVLVVGTVGRLQVVKDQLNLVRAFAIARRNGGEAAARLRLAIAGDGPLRPAIEDEIRQQDLADVVWMAGERKDVPDVMRSLGIFALPSRAEGISNTILEAMASGLPVVATDVGGNGELVETERTGLLVPAEEPVTMAEALMCYASNAALQNSHGLAGRLRVEQSFSLDGMVARYTELYERLLQRRSH
ncbi:TIGR03088 family PEP-CTERM/XrtA system glycosyltransferase [Thauera butanivorans]|uniref:TIGR03088 family PEP-CTERM/XrtA system glycosyltransferase n=1 Tax=Thauera butanivorans TaxID=86174 RepID=UPI000838BC25